MHSAKKLTRTLRKLADLLDQESSRNPGFADDLASVFEESFQVGTKRKRQLAETKAACTAPDVFQALEQNGEAEFQFWLRGLDTRILKQIIKENGFDPAKISSRWIEHDKFVELVAEQAIARMQRGSAFLTQKSKPQPSD